MKRRPETEAGAPPKIRSSSVRGLNGIRNNVQMEDVISAKRVKFLDPESDCQPNVRPNEPALLKEATRDPMSNAPKTSEYAFFKKLKENAGCSRSYASQKEENQSKNVEPSGCIRGISEKLKNIRDNSNSSFTVEKRRPITKTLFPSPLANASTNSEAAIIMNRDSDTDMRSPLLVEKVKPIDHSFLFSPLGGASRTSGTERLDGVFAEKRKRLRQWVANTSVSNTEASCSEGNEKPMQMRTGTKFSSYDFLKLDTGEEDCDATPLRDLLETKYGCFSGDVCNKSVDNLEIVPSEWDTVENLEIVPSEWDTEGCNAPLTKHASRSHFQFGRKKFRADYGDMMAIPDPYCYSSVKNYESAASRHIKGLNDFKGMHELVNGRGPSTLLLGWDVDSFNNQEDFSNTKQNAETNSPLAASWDDHKQSPDNFSVESELDISSFLFSYPSEFISLPYPHSAPFSNINGKFLLRELKHFPLSLPCNPTCDNLLKDRDTYDAFDGSSTFSSLNHQWVISKVFSEMHHSDVEAFNRPSSLGFDLGLTRFSMTGPFRELGSPSHEGSPSPSKESLCSYLLAEEQHKDCFYSLNHSQNIPHFFEDTINSHECLSTDFRTPTDKDMPTPVLLDSSSWLRTEEDLYYDDGEGIYI